MTVKWPKNNFYPRIFWLWMLKWWKCNVDSIPVGPNDVAYNVELIFPTSNLYWILSSILARNNSLHYCNGNFNTVSRLWPVWNTKILLYSPIWHTSIRWFSCRDRCSKLLLIHFLFDNYLGNHGSTKVLTVVEHG